MSNKLTFILGAFVVVMFVAAVFSPAFRSQNVEAMSAVSNELPYVATTSTSIAVTTSTRILATTSNPIGVPGVTSFNRVYAAICNNNANPVYLNLDADKAANTSNVTAIIAAAAGYNVCYVINDQNLYNGSITASSTNQTSTSVSVKDYVQ